jgi:hypothetical protein
MSFNWLVGAKVACDQEIRKRVRLARAVLGSKCDRASIEDRVWAVVIKQARWASRRPNSDNKEAVRRLAAALRVLEAALNNSNLPLYFRSSVQREDLSRLRKKCEHAADAPLPKPRRDVGDKRIVVREAANLLLELD